MWGGPRIPLGRITDTKQLLGGIYKGPGRLDIPSVTTNLPDSVGEDAQTRRTPTTGLIHHCAFLFEAHYWHSSRGPVQTLGTEMPIDTGRRRVTDPRGECRRHYSRLRQKGLPD